MVDDQYSHNSSAISYLSVIFVNKTMKFVKIDEKYR